MIPTEGVMEKSMALFRWGLRRRDLWKVGLAHPFAFMTTY